MVNLNSTIAKTTGLEYCYSKCCPWNHGGPILQDKKSKHLATSTAIV